MTHEEAYTAAFVYGLLLIDEKARARGEFKIPVDPLGCVEPEFDVKALIKFTQVVGSRILGADKTTLTHDFEVGQ